MKDLNELQQQRADLMARLEALDGTQDEQVAPRIEKQIAQLEQLISAPERLAAADAAEKDATAQSERLATSRKLVTDRIEQLRNDAALAIESAKFAEQGAADEIAQAVASADNKAAKIAQGKMDAASEAIRAALASANTGESLVRALEAQAAALEQQMEAAQQRSQEARTTARSAQRLMLSAEWDAAAEHLATIGAQLVNLLPSHGYYCMKALNVPMYLVQNQYPLTREDLLRMSDGKAA